MINFEDVQNGESFKFNGKTFTKIDKDTGLSITNMKQKIKFFNSKEKVDI